MIHLSIYDSSITIPTYNQNFKIYFVFKKVPQYINHWFIRYLWPSLNSMDVIETILVTCMQLYVGWSVIFLVACYATIWATFWSFLWSVGPLVRWSVGPLVHWSVCLFITNRFYGIISCFFLHFWTLEKTLGGNHC